LRFPLQLGILIVAAKNSWNQNSRKNNYTKPGSRRDSLRTKCVLSFIKANLAFLNREYGVIVEKQGLAYDHVDFVLLL